MAKKFFATIICIILFSTVTFAQLPYSKMLGLSDSELLERKFKYDSKKNQFVLKKSNKTNQTMNVFNAIGGASADIKPHSEDYVITVQKGANGEVAFLAVTFYDDNAYHNIETWMAENDIESINTSSGKLELQKFSYEDYNIEVAKELVSIQTATKNTYAAAKSFDQSYNIYSFFISTGIQPDSEWHRKEAAKKEKKQLKGEKADINDLM